MHSYVQCVMSMQCLYGTNSHRPVIAVKQTQSMVFERSPGTLGVLMSVCSHPGQTRVPPLHEWPGVHEIWMGIVLEAIQASQLSVDPIGNVDIP